MESIVINQKKLASAIFFAFSMSREISGQAIQPYTSPTEFIWQTAGDNPTFVYKIQRDHIAFRADAMDMILHLNEEFHKMKEINK